MRGVTELEEITATQPELQLIDISQLPVIADPAERRKKIKEKRRHRDSNIQLLELVTGASLVLNALLALVAYVMQAGAV